MACFSKPEHAEEIRSHDSVLPILDSDFFTSRPGISTHVGDPRWSLSHHRGFGFEVPHEVGEVRGAQILDAAWGNSRFFSDAHLNIPKRPQVSFYSDLLGPNILRDHIPKIDPQVCAV